MKKTIYAIIISSVIFAFISTANASDDYFDNCPSRCEKENKIDADVCVADDVSRVMRGWNEKASEKLYLECEEEREQKYERCKKSCAE